MRQLLFDPRLRIALDNHWPSVCTIQTVVFTTGASGQKTPSSYTNTSMVNLQCRIGVRSLDQRDDNEHRDPKIEAQLSQRVLKINGYYPSIVSRTMVAVVDGIMWQIRGVECDSQHFSTRLKLEIIKP